MSEPQPEGGADTRQHELVIIRRRSDGEEAPHKGGVWKIAHADFMTALMAFFLVMWLITATDDKTITGVANYFNPMRLSEAITKPKGVFTMEAGEDQENDNAKSKKGAADLKDKPSKTNKVKKGAPKNSEATMFSDPYEALDEIAAQAPNASSPPLPTEKENAAGHLGGQEYRDPFVPDLGRAISQQGKPDGESGKKNGSATTVAKNDASGGGGLKDAAANSDATKNDTAKGDSQKADGAKSDADKSETNRSEISRVTAEADASTEAERESKGAELRQKIEDIVSESKFAALPGINVEVTREGILISVTDQYNFEMFGIASAKPKPELVVVMGKIGEILAKEPGHLVIRGHTDGRPFRSDDYDNWRLSTARAHMANYMLERSGVAKQRIDRIEGYADRDLKVRSDPLAAPNRRIEILLLGDRKP
jgi:chemotaxis protein MotB